MIPTITYPAELPVSQRRDDIAAAIRDNQVVIVAGETGSGKTTQLPKMCMELGRGIQGVIGHTQPRRLAARTVAIANSVTYNRSGNDVTNVRAAVQRVGFRTLGARWFRIEFLDESPAEVGRILNLYRRLLAGTLSGAAASSSPEAALAASSCSRSCSSRTMRHHM